MHIVPSQATASALASTKDAPAMPAALEAEKNIRHLPDVNSLW